MRTPTPEAPIRTASDVTSHVHARPTLPEAVGEACPTLAARGLHRQ
ncbi:hypothetical protein ACFFKE_14950 [Streptomyces mutabilis]|nr:hypothetical protein [Streptomyces mutabilis]